MMVLINHAPACHGVHVHKYKKKQAVQRCRNLGDIYTLILLHRERLHFSHTFITTFLQHIFFLYSIHFFS